MPRLTSSCLATMLGALALLSASAPARAQDLPTTQQLLDYVELAYENFFPAHVGNQSLPPYTYRAYPSVGNYIGVGGNQIYLFGKIVPAATAPVAVAAVSDFACDRVPGACGDRIDATITVEGVAREFVVWRPYKARGRQGLPAVLMLHGTSGTGAEFLLRSGWREKADREGFIAVFPQALFYCYVQDENFDGVPDINAFTKWAAGKLGDPDKRPLCNADQLATLTAANRARADHPLMNDETYIRAVVEHVRVNHAVDPKQVYVSGFSNGCEMAANLAATAADVFAAVHCASSALSVDTLASRAIAVVHSMGNKDPDQGRALGYYDSATGQVNVPLDETVLTTGRYATGIVAPFLRVLQLGQTYTWQQVPTSGRITSRFRFASSTVGASNSLLTVIIDGLAHEYPNGKNHPVVMADEIWEFFKTQRLP